MVNIRKAVKYQSRNVSYLCLSNIGDDIKNLCKSMIHYQLNRNGFITDQYKQNPFNLNKYAVYAQQLLHQFCLNKKGIKIDWKAMSVDILTECDVDGGYIGYSFIKSLFCKIKYQGINLNVFHVLFPNLRVIQISYLSLIDSNFLNDIYLFIQNNKKSKIWYFSLRICPEFGVSNILNQCTMYQTKFQCIAWTMFASSYRNSNGRVYACLVIEKQTNIL